MFILLYYCPSIYCTYNYIQWFMKILFKWKFLDDRIENGEAEVDFRQVTRSLDNQDFHDNQVTGVHIMRQQNGEWKIYDSQVEETELID